MTAEELWPPDFHPDPALLPGITVSENATGARRSLGALYRREAEAMPQLRARLSLWRRQDGFDRRPGLPLNFKPNTGASQ